MVEIKAVELDVPEGTNVIVGQSHFIKTVEDIHEALVGTFPGIKFGLAFNEASGPCLVRSTGTDDGLVELARANAVRVGAGHTFYLYLGNCFPINIMPALRAVPEVCCIFAATANPLQILVAESEQGRGIMGVIDGFSPRGTESPEDVEKRKEFLRMIGYKL